MARIHDPMPHERKDTHHTTAIAPAANNRLSAGIGRPAVVPAQKRQKPEDGMNEQEDLISPGGDAAIQMKGEMVPVLNNGGRRQGDGETVPFQLKPNNTGLPDNLKSSIEGLSGISMDDVRVHYNSSRPAQLQALAFAQGADIHVAPGQERHLPHEAWHVVQQKQGRVHPTIQMKDSLNVNDDEGLEREADIMGSKALTGGDAYRFDAYTGSGHIGNGYTGNYPGPPLQRKAAGGVIQLLPATKVAFGMTRAGAFETPEKMDADPLSQAPGNTTGSPVQDGKQGRLISLLQRERPGAYAASHLLNEEFHGPGDHRNLVPLSYATNNLMANTIEQYVRSYWRQNEVVAYQVRVNYGITGRTTIPEENCVPESLDFRLIPQEERTPGQWSDKRGFPPLVLNIKHELPADVAPHGRSASDRAVKGAKKQQNISLLSFLPSSSGRGVLDESKDEAKDDAIIVPPDLMKEFERKSMYESLIGKKGWLDIYWAQNRSHYKNEEQLLAQVSGELKHKDLKQGTISLDVAIRIVMGQKIEMIGDVKDRNVDSMLEKYVEDMLERYTDGVPEKIMESIILDVKGLIMDHRAITEREDLESELLREMEAEHYGPGAVDGSVGSSGGQPVGVPVDGPGTAVKGMDLEDDSEKPQAKPKEKRIQYSFTYQRSFFRPTDKDRLTNANIYKLKTAIDAGVNGENAASIYEMIKIVHAGLTECTAEAEPGTPSPFDQGHPPSYSRQYYEAVMLVWTEGFSAISNAEQLPGFSGHLKSRIAQVAAKAGRLF